MHRTYVFGDVHRARMGNESRESIRQSKHLSYGNTSWARKHRDILGEHLGSFRTSTAAVLLAVLARCSWAKLPMAVSDYIDSFVPRSVDPKTWERIAPFVRDSVTLAAPKTPYSAEVLIGRASRYVAWCVRKGWPLDAETIWSLQGVDLFVNDPKLDLDKDTRRNYRSWLMRMAQVLLPEENGSPRKPIKRSQSVAAPYTPKEMAEFRRWAGVQRTELKRYRAMLMLALCAGAGLRPVDFEDLKPEHIEELAHGGYVVHVQGKDRRDVPLLAEWDEWMGAVLDSVPEDHETLWGKPNKARRYSSLSGFAQTCVGNPPVSGRLRETWAVAVLTPIAQLKSVFRAAGVQQLDKLPLLLHFIDDVGPEEYIEFLRGEEQS